MPRIDGMKFASEEQRKIVMAKLNPNPSKGLPVRADKGKGKGKTRRARIPRGKPPPTYRTKDRAGCWERVDRAIRRGDRDFDAGDWSAACFRYHQAAEQACYGAGAKGRHNITDLLRSLDSPNEGERQAGS
jgi:hypothetical protein